MMVYRSFPPVGPIISSFDAALEVLENDVLMMSSLTDQNFQTAIEALLNRDSELCNS